MPQTNARLNPATMQLMAMAFIGIHVPLVALILFGIFTGFAGLWMILLTVLGATLVSTAVTLALIWRVMTVAPAGRMPAAAA